MVVFVVSPERSSVAVALVASDELAFVWLLRAVCHHVTVPETVMTDPDLVVGLINYTLR